MPYSYLWSTSDATQTVTGLGPGTYNVTVSDANGCTDEQSVTVEEPAMIGVTVVCTDETTANANDGICTVMVNGGTMPYMQEWSTGPTGVTTINNLEPGTYCVTITDDMNCLQESCGTVNSGSCNLEALVITEDVFCAGEQNGSATVIAIIV